MKCSASQFLTLVQDVSLDSPPGGRYSLLSECNVIKLAPCLSQDNVVNLRK